MKIGNLIRYILVAGLVYVFFFSVKVEINKNTIDNMIQKKMPMTIDKKGLITKIDEFEIIDVSDGVMNIRFSGTVKAKNANSFKKLLTKDEGVVAKVGSWFHKTESIKTLANKTYDLDIEAKLTPFLKNNKISFKLESFNINGKMKVKHVNKTLSNQIEKFEIPIKKLEQYSFIAHGSNLKFCDDGNLCIDVEANSMIVLILIATLLLREIGLVLINLYQTFLSPRKGYKCAKGHYNGNGTCSSTTKEAFKEGGFITGMKEYRKSTKECRATYEAHKNGSNSNCDTYMCLALDTNQLAFAGDATASACDVGTCDVGAC